MGKKVVSTIVQYIFPPSLVRGVLWRYFVFLISKLNVTLFNVTSNAYQGVNLVLDLNQNVLKF